MLDDRVLPMDSAECLAYRVIDSFALEVNSTQTETWSHGIGLLLLP